MRRRTPRASCWILPTTSREVDDRPPEPIDPADSAALAEALEDVRAGRIASDAEVEAAYASFKSPR